MAHLVLSKCHSVAKLANIDFLIICFFSIGLNFSTFERLARPVSLLLCFAVSRMLRTVYPSGTVASIVDRALHYLNWS